jgi:hypothetical protein
MAENAGPGNGTGGNMNRTLVIVGGLVIVALVGVIIALAMNLNRSESVIVVQEEPRGPQRATLVEEGNAEEVLEEMLEEVTPSGPTYYEVEMNMEWHFPDGASPSTDAHVANNEDNTTPVYFDVTLRDTGETIYESPVIPLGGVLENFSLDTALEKGTYPCVCTYHLIDDQQRTLSTLNMGMTVIVEN